MTRPRLQKQRPNWRNSATTPSATSCGHPRAINNQALHALTAAFAADHAIVGEKAARIAMAETAVD